MSYKETKYGYIPDGGSIYFLSRLNGEVGTYLALTGREIYSGDMKKLGVSDGLIQDENFLKEHIIINLVNRDLSFSLNTSTKGLEKFEDQYAQRQKEKHEQNPFGINDILTTTGKMKLDYLNNKMKEPYQYPWLRDSDDNKGDFNTTPFTHLFNKEIYGEATKEDVRSSFRHFTRSYTNTFTNFEKQILYGIVENNHELNSIEILMKQINKYFRFDSLKDIMESLQENISIDPFAAKCLESMQSKSLIALEVTLALLRKAKSLDYEQCMRMEMNAAKNLIIKSPDFESFFDNSINNKNSKGKSTANQEETKRFFASEYSQDFIRELIESESGTENIELEVKANSLLPNKTYRNSFPDSFRLWINEHPRANKTIREFFDYEIKHYMMEKLNIDLRDTRVTIAEVRKVISSIYANDFAKHKNNEKVYNLISDNNFINEYVKTRKQFCDKFLAEADNSIPKLKVLITTKTREIFEKSFKQTCNNILHKCKDVRDIEKRRTWHRLRKWLFTNRIMNYKSKGLIIQNLRIAALGEKSLYIPLDEAKSWRDELNPDVMKSPFYQLAGLFKLKKISPEYALKFSTTDLNSDKLFNYLEINQEKLKEIRELVKENPKKLIEIFNSALDKETKMLFDTLEDKKLLEYDRLYRIRNDGKSPIDEMNFVNEFRALKDKWWNYRNNVLEMLRKLTLDAVYQIVDNPEFYTKSSFYQANKKIDVNQIKQQNKADSLEKEDLEDYKTLYSLLNKESDDLAFFGGKSASGATTLDVTDTNNIIESIKSSFLNSHDKVFASIISNLINEENKLIKDFSQKTFDFTKSLILHFMLENSNINNKNNKANLDEKTKPVKIEDFNVKESLEKLFSFDSKQNSQSNSEATRFVHHIYLKYGSVNAFKDALKNTKNTAIEILDQLTESEISNHYASLLKKVPEKNINKINAIYQKEKSLFEDLLRKFYEMKLNLSKLEIIQIENANNTNTEIPFEYQKIDYFIGKLQDIAFSEFILADRTQKCPVNIDMLIKKDYTEEQGISQKQKQLVELYVTLKENTLNKDSQHALSALTKSMKNSEWFAALDAYSKNCTEGNLSDLVSDLSQNKNLDLKVENFMNNKFRNYIYEENNKNVEKVNKDVLENIAESKLTAENIEELVSRYKLDKTKLNEEIYDEGLLKKGTIMANRNSLNKIKLMLTDKINEFLRNYNVDELTKKLIDYEFNKDFHLHRILCSIAEVESFYDVKGKENLKDMTDFINYGEHLLKFKRMINENKKSLHSESKLNSRRNQLNKNNMAKVNLLKNISFKKNEYIAKLEQVKAFLDARDKYLNKIYNEFYGLFNYSEKYQINVLAENIQADFAKLYNFLKENYLKNKQNASKTFENFSEFIASNATFANAFGEINFDEFIGLENYEIIKRRIDQINELKVKEQNAYEAAGVTLVSDKEIQNIVRKLVVEEIEKSQTFVFSNEMKVDESVNILLEKEKEICESLQANGFRLKSAHKDLNSFEKTELINEYKLKFKHFIEINGNKNEANPSLPADNFMHKANAPINSEASYISERSGHAQPDLTKTLKKKIEAKLFSLKQISKIAESNNNSSRNSNMSKDFIVNLNSSQIELNKKSLAEFLEEFNDYGLKYNNTLKYMTGDKLSLRDMILKGYDKTMSDYNEHELSSVFTDKIPSDVIKTALEVLDAKLIKAVKIINSDLLLKNLANSDGVLSELVKILQLEKSELAEEQKKFGENKIEQYNEHEDFEQLEHYKNYLERIIEDRNSEESTDEEAIIEGAEDEAVVETPEVVEEEDDDLAEENAIEDEAYKAVRRIYDLKKQANKVLVDTQSKKSVFDINISESIKNEIYANYLEQHKNKQKKVTENDAKTDKDSKVVKAKSDDVEADDKAEEDLEEKVANEEESSPLYQRKQQEIDPSKLTDKELKAIYIQKIKDLVDLPNFKNKYSLMKYIYDYYMGTLAVDYDSHFQDAEERLGLVNEAVFLDRIEKSYHTYGNLPEFRQGAGILDASYYNKLMDKGILDRVSENKPYKLAEFTKSDPMEYFKESLFPYKEDRSLYENLGSQAELDKINTYRNLAFDYLKIHHPSRAIFPNTDRPYLQIMQYEIEKYVENYYYAKMVKDKTKDETYNNFSANLLTSTEKFRLEASKNQKKNAEISAMRFNTYEGEVGYAKLANEENKSADNLTPIDKAFDTYITKIFGNYLQNKKDKIIFTKEKLNEVKQNLAHSANLISVNNPYDLLKLSNQEYIELKNYKDVEGNLSSIPDTVNPASPIKLDLETFLKSNTLSKEYPEFNASDITEIVELDNAMSFANFGKYCSIPHWLIDEAEKKTEENYLEKYLEASPEKFIEYAVEELVEDFYLMRHQIERNLTRDELRSFDLEHLDYFSYENISHLLRIKINELLMDIHLTQDEAQYYQNKFADDYIQKTKIQSNQYYFNQSIKDEDAFYKSVAYRLRMDKIKQDKVNKHFKDTNSKSKKVPSHIKHSLEDNDSFEFWYYANLQNDRFRPNSDGNLSYEEMSKRDGQKLFSYINGKSLDDNYTSDSKLQNSKFLVEFGESNLDKSKISFFLY